MCTAVRSGLYARFFAGCMHRADGTDQRLYGDRKQSLLGALRGTVVEIGAGAGPNARYLAAGTRWVAVEPNVHMHPYLQEQADEFGLDVRSEVGVAEALPVDDASADAVVSTLVLCSVDDVAQTLAEVRRVLKPGGRFVFIEHVAAQRGTVRRGAQRVFRRPWGWVADGCRPDRETGLAIEAAGFASLDLERFDADLPFNLVTPHIAGVAI
ncbi:MAG: class I SAM-dependent methyltransferase, partial [Bacteroidota bacterium]